MSIQKKVLITGASSGLGAEVAEVLGQQGHHIFLVSRNEEKVKKICDRVRKAGGTVNYGIGDISDEQAVDKLFNQARNELGGEVDIFFGNAATATSGPLENMTVQDFDRLFGANVKGVFLWLRKIVPLMKLQKCGQIIIPTWCPGSHHRANASLFCASKWAVQGLVACLRDELKGTGVKAATVCAAGIGADWWEVMKHSDEIPGDQQKPASLDEGKVRDLESSILFLINQSTTCNIDKICVESMK